MVVETYPVIFGIKGRARLFEMQDYDPETNSWISTQIWKGIRIITKFPSIKTSKRISNSLINRLGIVKEGDIKPNELREVIESSYMFYCIPEPITSENNLLQEYDYLLSITQ